MPDTETMDRLYLEWSQFTTAMTRRELDLTMALEEIYATGTRTDERGETTRSPEAMIAARHLEAKIRP